MFSGEPQRSGVWLLWEAGCPWQHLPAGLFPGARLGSPLLSSHCSRGRRLGPGDSPAPCDSSFSQAVQRQRLRRILRAWRLRARGPGHQPAGARTISASGLPGSTPRSSPEEVSGGRRDEPGQVGDTGEERVGMGMGRGRHPGVHTLPPGVQGTRPPGAAVAGLSAGSWAKAAGAVPSALAGAGSAGPGCGEVAPAHPSEAVGTLPQASETGLPLLSEFIVS